MGRGLGGVKEPIGGVCASAGVSASESFLILWSSGNYDLLCADDMATPSQILVCPSCQAPNRIPTSRLSDDPRCGKCKQQLFSGHPISLTDQTFDKHLSRSDIPLVVDFWAPWCGPCKMMAPFFEQAASELEPRVRLAKVNTDENRALAMRYQINSIPTTAVFKGGREVARQPGAMNLPQLLQLIKSNT